MKIHSEMSETVSIFCVYESCENIYLGPLVHTYLFAIEVFVIYVEVFSHTETLDWSSYYVSSLVDNLVIHEMLLML